VKVPLVAEKTIAVPRPISGGKADTIAVPPQFKLAAETLIQVELAVQLTKAWPPEVLSLALTVMFAAAVQVAVSVSVTASVVGMPPLSFKELVNIVSKAVPLPVELAVQVAAVTTPVPLTQLVIVRLCVAAPVTEMARLPTLSSALTVMVELPPETMLAGLAVTLDTLASAFGGILAASTTQMTATAARGSNLYNKDLGMLSAPPQGYSLQRGWL
jgi:hypothetical protein